MLVKAFKILSRLVGYLVIFLFLTIGIALTTLSAISLIANEPIENVEQFCLDNVKTDLNEKDRKLELMNCEDAIYREQALGPIFEWGALIIGSLILLAMYFFVWRTRKKRYVKGWIAP